MDTETSDSLRLMFNMCVVNRGRPLASNKYYLSSSKIDPPQKVLPGIAALPTFI
jgi:hypothetical protein